MILFTHMAARRGRPVGDQKFFLTIVMVSFSDIATVILPLMILPIYFEEVVVCPSYLTPLVQNRISD